MNKSILFSTLLLVAVNASLAQSNLLQSGPMLGYSDMREVLLWVQTSEAATVHFEYWEVDTLGQSIGERFNTEKILTAKANAFTAKIIADEVQPSKTYDYSLFINNQVVALDYPTTFQSQTLWQWRFEPPAFTVALGSCNYVNDSIYDRPGRPYGNYYDIFTSIHKKRPDVMIWLGDNTYLREADWSTRTGILHRYTHTRSVPELQPLLASTHHYAIWDDHDFGPNNSDRSYIHKDKTLEAFKLFWGNPSYGMPDVKGGITTHFQWNDIEFFMLDNRYFRSPNDRESGESTILGEEQLEWLIDALTASKATFKMVAIGGQVLNTLEKWENYIHKHSKERSKILRRIEQENIKNVIFLSGDRHHSELSKLVNGAGNTIYDLTCSPLTSGTGQRDEENRLRVPDTMVTERNFGLLSFSGPRKERQLKIQLFNTAGEELWMRTISAE